MDHVAQECSTSGPQAKCGLQSHKYLAHEAPPTNQEIKKYGHSPPAAKFPSPSNRLGLGHTPSPSPVVGWDWTMLPSPHRTSSSQVPFPLWRWVGTGASHATYPPPPLGRARPCPLPHFPRQGQVGARMAPAPLHVARWDLP